MPNVYQLLLTTFPVMFDPSGEVLDSTSLEVLFCAGLTENQLIFHHAVRSLSFI